MGLFDYLVCEYPLPDNPDAATLMFQTKDTPAQYMMLYILRRDGRLMYDASGDIIPFHGALTFYATNWCALGPHGYATKDDQPLWCAEYTAIYDHGQLLKIEGGTQHEPVMYGPHLTRAAWHALVREQSQHTTAKGDEHAHTDGPPS